MRSNRSQSAGRTPRFFNSAATSGIPVRRLSSCVGSFPSYLAFSITPQAIRFPAPRTDNMRANDSPASIYFIEILPSYGLQHRPDRQLRKANKNQNPHGWQISEGSKGSSVEQF
jgi:hypothetical protein